MTLGVQLCLRWFGEGQQVVRRLDLQAHQRGLGGRRGPNINEDDVEWVAIGHQVADPLTKHFGDSVASSGIGLSLVLW